MRHRTQPDSAARGFVRPDGVEVLPPNVEVRLLFGDRCRRRPRHILAQRAVHAFVPAILVRPAGGNAIGPDVQLQQPHRQLRQPAQSGAAGKRAAVIGAKRTRQPMAAKQPGQDRLHVRCGDLRHRSTGQQVAAIVVGDRQRVAANAIPGAEPALEIRRPTLVRGRRLNLGLFAGRIARPPRPRLRKSFPVQKIPDRAGRRPNNLRTIDRQTGQ